MTALVPAADVLLPVGAAPRPGRAGVPRERHFTTTLSLRRLEKVPIA
jgi:hypothetical protein